LKRAGTVHVGGSRMAMAESENLVDMGKHPTEPYVLVSQPSLVDSSRAPAGRHILWTYCHVPAGSDVDMAEAVTARIERYAPGFRDVVVAAKTTTAAELAVYNENYVQPPMPDRPGVVEGILKGIYKYQAAEQTGGLVAQLFGSGSILNEALKAQKILAEKYQIAADVWSVTSYNELRREALETDRWNRLNPTQPARVPYISQVMQNERGPVIASSDYIKAQADQLSPWLGSRLTSLGADGFGRSENREYLRKFFEISAEAIVQATLSSLARNGDLDPQIAAQATADF